MNISGNGSPVLLIEDLVVEIPLSIRKRVHAVSGISMNIYPNETVGLVGESGCGKSTTGKAIIGLVRPTSGYIRLNGHDVIGLKGKPLRQARRNAQLVFQDPISSLNPRRSILKTIVEPMAVWSMGTPAKRREKVVELLEQVGLDPALIADRFPYQLSGGQCQRVSIARALALSPALLICDEPVSALDVSVQAQILNLLHDLQDQYKMAMLFISHDLSVIRNMSDRIAVMYMGRMCEMGPTTQVYNEPLHPYTRMLLDAIPNPESISTHSNLIPGSATPELSSPPPSPEGISSPLHPPSGCRFHPRCPYADISCQTTQPEMAEVRQRHLVACHHPVGQINHTAEIGLNGGSSG
ncbi:MAG: ABC transporter ATP-binding protein [Actinobacteria bacterium]|nr:ABC transporter ATP-binding protein [Actinomycetota bacterium]